MEKYMKKCIFGLTQAKQREKEIQGLKMRLRFRESGIKRLEEVTSGMISAETHLLKEKEEYLKEIEVLRSQIDRNQDVTRFAMENLRLKEEIRRYVNVIRTMLLALKLTVCVKLYCLIPSFPFRKSKNTCP